MTEKKLPNGLKLVFAPGCFDNFEGTQEELDQLVKEIEAGFMDGSFVEKATEIDTLNIDDLDDEDLVALDKALEMLNNQDRNRTLN